MKNVNFFKGLALTTFGLAILPTSALATAPTVAQSFTPTSVKIPIFSIGFVDPTNTTVNIAVYQCAANTVSGCTVDIADSSAVAAMFTNSAATKVAAGTYYQMYANTCVTGGTGYTMQVKGSFTNSGFGGGTYYTASGSEPLTTSSGSQDYTSFSVNGCQTNFGVPGGVTVTDGSQIEINVLTNITNLAYALNGVLSSPSGTCKVGSSYSLCANYIPLVPYVSSSTPTLQTYLLTDSGDSTGANAYGQLLFFIDPSNNIIGVQGGTTAGTDGVVSTTPLSSVASVPEASSGNCNSGACNWKNTPFIEPFKNFSTNTDGTLNLIEYGDVDTMKTAQTETTGSPVVLSSFKTISSVNGTATGTMTSPLKYFDSTMQDATIQVNYTALRIK